MILKFRSEVFGFQISDFRFAILDLRFWIADSRGSPFRCLRSLLTFAQESAISNQQSAFSNPQSVMSYVPQSTPNRRPLLVWLIVAFGSVGTIGLILGAPLALKAGFPFPGLTLYRSFSYLCHQIPERSFFIAEHPFAVCSRCFGLYAGFAAAVIFYPLVKSLRTTEAPERKWLVVAALPMAIDFSIEFLGFGHNTHFSRFSTGALIGAVAVFYVIPGLMELSLGDWRPKTRSSPAAQPASSPSKVFTGNPASAPSDYSAPHRRI